METNHDELIDQFVGITGCNAETARSRLEARNWDIEEAVSDHHRSESQSNAPSTTPFQRFATLSSLERRDGSSDEEEGQAFYAGGSERSGQQVIGPGKKKTGNDIVSEMFKAAKEHGAEVVDPSTSSSESRSARARLVPFRGTGYRLGATETDREEIPGSSLSNVQPLQEFTLKMWKNGFSIDDGPHRDYGDPSNKDFLESIRRGEIPRELIRAAQGSEVNLNMEDHRHEDYVAPAQKIKAFSGAGHVLGSPAPNVATNTMTTPEANQSNEEAASRVLGVHSSGSTTSLQIRLADGSKLVAKLNPTHTVGDIRRFITMYPYMFNLAGNPLTYLHARPQYEASVFTLMTTFPSQELCEDNVTLKDANLLNAVVVQRLM